MGDMPLIDRDKCRGCGLCVNVCACGALVIQDNAVRAIEVGECLWCTLCELVCPNSAISCPFEIILESDEV
jgi:MinD superfamily P-loop ATPase